MMRGRSEFAAVDREVSVLTCDAADLALRCGQTRLILPTVRKAVERDPLDEALHARLLLCPTQNGKQARRPPWIPIRSSPVS
jgi:hypothetical protein